MTARNTKNTLFSFLDAFTIADECGELVNEVGSTREPAGRLGADGGDDAKSGREARSASIGGSEVPGVGCAGTVHDWEVSAAIVEAVRVPVILAGGSSADNVAAAIAPVRPWDVDSLSHTNRAVAGGASAKKVDLVRRFVAAARGAAEW